MISKRLPRRWDPPFESLCYRQWSGNGNWVQESNGINRTWGIKKEASKNDSLVSGFEDLGVVFLLTQEEARDRGAGRGEEFSSCLFWPRCPEALPAKVEQVGTLELWKGFRGAGDILFPRPGSGYLGLCESLHQTYMNYVFVCKPVTKR